METATHAEMLKMIARGEVDLDLIAEAIRSADLVIRQYQAETEILHQHNEQLELDFEKEKSAVDDLARRLAELHEENRLARQVFQVEIEGKRSVLGLPATLDVEALDMAGLIREREKVQRQLGQSLRGVNRETQALR